MPKMTFADLCKEDAKPGYALDHAKVIKNETITNATKDIYKHITDTISKVEEGSGKEVDYVYVGKSHVRKLKKKPFDPKAPNTWRLDDGVNKRYSDHVKKCYGKNGLIVVAVVTNESIPADCKKDGYITHQEEYALTLEKRLIQNFRKEEKDMEDDDKRLANKTTAPGNTDQVKAVGYLIYIAFALSKFNT